MSSDGIVVEELEATVIDTHTLAVSLAYFEKNAPVFTIGDSMLKEKDPTELLTLVVTAIGLDASSAGCLAVGSFMGCLAITDY